MNRGFFALAYDIGPDQMLANYPVSDREEAVQLWDDFEEYFDDIVRKTLCFYGGGGKRVMIKGHYLAAAKGLEERYPNADFLTVVREPRKRLER